jgi:hypothetical protein
MITFNELERNEEESVEVYFEVLIGICMKSMTSLRFNIIVLWDVTSVFMGYFIEVSVTRLHSDDARMIYK